MNISVIDNVLVIGDVQGPTTYNVVRAVIRTMDKEKALEGVTVLNLKDVHPHYEVKFPVDLCNDLGRLFEVVAASRGEGYTVLMSFNRNYPPGHVISVN